MLLPILNSAGGRGFFEVSWLLESACYCAVDCFGLISGYVGAGRSVSPGKALTLWLQVEFYSLGLTLLGLALRSPVSGDPLGWAAAPVTSGQYWYISAYFGAMLLMPLLEEGVRRLPRQTLGLLALGALALSVSNTFLAPDASMSLEKVSGLSGGYNVIWLAMLYLLGGFLRRSRLTARMSVAAAALVYLSALAVTWGSVLLGDWRCLSYTSPTVLLMGAALTTLFSKLRLNRPVRRAVSVAAPASLGVYLIHIHPWLYRAFTGNLTLTFPAYGGAACGALVMVTGAGVYLVSTALELIRQRLFKWLGAGRLAPAVDGLFARLAGGEARGGGSV